MAYIVDRVVICDAYAEPDRHYQLLPGGESKLVKGRRPSLRYSLKAAAGYFGQGRAVEPEGWVEADSLVLSPLNPEFTPIVLNPKDEEALQRHVR